MNSELQHHGILGMHWGIRRYQNPDGSYTAAGRKRRAMLDDAAKYARSQAERNEIDAQDIADDLEEFKERYSGEEGIKRYREDWVDDDDLTDEDIKEWINSDIEYSQKQYQWAVEWAKDWYDQADEFQSYSVDDIPSEVLRRGKKYANWLRKDTKNG